MNTFTAVMSLVTAVSGAHDNSECWGELHVPIPQEAGTSMVTGGHQLLAIGGGQVANMMPGWIDPETAGSRFFDFPESQMLNYAYIPPWMIEEGSFMRFWCADHSSIQKCDIYVNLYKCSDCEPGLNTDFSDYLITRGFIPSQCGPKFISDEGEEHHKFVTFRKQVPSNHMEYIYIDYNVKLMFVTMDSNGVGCSDFELSKCETSGYKQCKLIKGECRDNWCPRIFQGPLLGGCPAPPCVRCNNCALKEPAFLKK